MWTIDLETDGVATYKPSVPPAGTQGNFSDTSNTILPDWWMNMIQGELANVITNLYPSQYPNRGVKTEYDVYATLLSYDDGKTIDINDAGEIAAIRMSLEAPPSADQCYVCFHGYTATTTWVKFGYGYNHGASNPWTIYIACGISNEEMLVYEFDPIAEGFTYDKFHEYRIMRSDDLSTLEIIIDDLVVASKDASFLPPAFEISQVRLMCDGYSEEEGEYCMAGIVDYVRMGTDPSTAFAYYLNESPDTRLIIDSNGNNDPRLLQGNYNADRRVLIVGNEDGLVSTYLDASDDHQVSKAIQYNNAQIVRSSRCPMYYVRTCHNDDFNKPSQFTEANVYVSYVLPTYGGSFYYTTNVVEHEGGNRFLTGSTMFSIKLKAVATGSFIISSAFIDDNLYIHKDEVRVGQWADVSSYSPKDISIDVEKDEIFILNLVHNDSEGKHWDCQLANDFLSKYSDIIQAVPTDPEDYPVYT